MAVYPRAFWPNGGIGKTRPREALPRAPTCFKWNYGLQAWCARSTCRARPPFFFGYGVGATGNVAQEGSKRPPLLTTCWGGMPPQLY